MQCHYSYSRCNVAGAELLWQQRQRLLCATRTYYRTSCLLEYTAHLLLLLLCLLLIFLLDGLTILSMVVGMGRSDSDEIWDKSATVFSFTTACLSFSMSGSSSRVRTRHSFCSDLGSVSILEESSGKLDQLLLEGQQCMRLVDYVTYNHH